MERWVISGLLVTTLYILTLMGREVSSADLSRRNIPRNSTLELVENVNASLDISFQGLIDISQNETMQEVFKENARLAREDAIVDKALMIIGIGAGVIITLGLGYYAKMGYCTSEV